MSRLQREAGPGQVALGYHERNCYAPFGTVAKSPYSPDDVFARLTQASRPIGGIVENTGLNYTDVLATLFDWR